MSVTVAPLSAGWSEGYVTDTLYTDMIFREQSPVWLNYVAALKGCAPRPLDRPFRYLELGCGLGRSIATFAACFPQGEFVAVDFNPAHIDYAQRRAAEMGLTNLRYVEASFQELAADPLGQGAARDFGDFDFATLHGIYSWIPPEARQGIQRLLLNRVKPGGLIYNSYNALPGWAQEAPLQRLIEEFSKGADGDSAQRVTDAMARISEMAALPLGYLGTNPQLKTTIAGFAKKSGNYLAHEFLNGQWNAFYVTDVVDEMMAAKLDFLGSATLMENYPDLILQEAPLAFFNKQTNPSRRELLQDFLTNKRFRRDVFVRGHARLNDRDQRRVFDEQALVAPKSPDKLSTSFKVPRGTINFGEKIAPVLKEAFATGAVRVADIIAACAKLGVRNTDVSRALAICTAAGQLLPATKTYAAKAGSTGGGKVAAQRFTNDVNKRLLGLALDKHEAVYLVSPVSGGSLVIGAIEGILLDLAQAGGSVDALRDKLAKLMAARGIQPARDGKAITEPAALQDYLQSQTKTFAEETLPTLHRMGILEGV